MAESPYSLEWLDPSGAYTQRPLPEGTLTIGRSPSCDVVINDDPQVSGTHLRLTVEGGSVRIEDAGSTNGTLMNGAKVSSAAPSLLDEWVLGSTLMHYVERWRAPAPTTIRRQPPS